MPPLPHASRRQAGRYLPPMDRWSVHVIPTKAGKWRVTWMSPQRAARWGRAYRKWYRLKGVVLKRRHPEMWRED